MLLGWYVSYLAGEEIQALVAAPDRTICLGRRDHALILLAIQTGLRVSELVALCCKDISTSDGAHVRVRTGNGTCQRK